MPTNLRPATERDLPALSALCLRSKAHWGYDDAFMAACRDELTLTAEDLATSSLMLIEDDGRPLGIVQLILDGTEADLGKLYIAPEAMGRGIGRQLFAWATATARSHGAFRMAIEADPSARPFYEHMGATLIGEVPSGSIPGRKLPLLSLDLRSQVKAPE